jgi:uncharacterized protein (TIGR03437 family)
MPSACSIRLPRPQGFHAKCLVTDVPPVVNPMRYTCCILAIVLNTLNPLYSQSACKSEPSLAYATYLGGSDFEHVRDVATDAAGNLYVTGGTQSADLPATTRLVNTGATETGVSNFDIFVIKLNPAGAVLWSTRIGGPNYDRAYAIEIDPKGFIILAGRAGRGFPVTAGAFQTTFKGGSAADFYGNQDGVIIKLSPDGQKIEWASYFGSEDPKIIRDIAVDANGDIFAASNHVSGTYIPSVAAAFQNRPLGGSDGVLAKVAGDGSRVLWAWYVGGSADEGGGQPSVRVDSAGNPYYLTLTSSKDARTTPSAYSRSLAGGVDFYLSKWSGDGSLIFATYVGGSADELYETHNLALDSYGNAYIGASTLSTDFPTTPGAFSRTHNGNGRDGTGARTNYPGDGVIAKISSNGTRLLASTFLGGRFGDAIEGLAVDSDGYVHVTGGTYSDNFPVSPGSYQKALKGTINSFYVELSSDLSTLIYGTYIGGGQDAGRTMAVDGSGAAYFGGEADIAGFPVRNALQPVYGGGGDAFLAKIAPSSKTGAPCYFTGSVVNAGSYLPGVVPGGLISIFGSGLLRDINGTIPGLGATLVQGTTVSIGGIQVPIFSLTNQAGVEQINVQAPFEIAGSTSVDVVIQSSGRSVSLTETVLPAQPGIFEWTSEDGKSNGAALHADGSLITPANPARRGEIVSAFFTGGGPLAESVATGAAGPSDSLATMSLALSVEMDGRPCDVSFKGYAPLFIGLYQVNFRIRDEAPSSSSVTLRLNAGGAVSPSTLLPVQP